MDLTSEDPVQLLRQVVAHCGVHRDASRSHQLWSAVFATIASPPPCWRCRGTQPGDVDALVEKLDARCAETGERWEVYRLSTGGWRAHAYHRYESETSDPAAVSAVSDSMRTALAELLATPRLPVVPRRPPYGAGRMEVVKDGSEWAVREDGQWIGRRHTKRDGLAHVEQYEAAMRAQYEAWMAEWGALVESGVEGQDFYWK